MLISSISSQERKNRMDIIKSHAVKNLCYITAQKMVPAGIVLHSTGANNPYLKRYVDCPELLGVNIYGNHWNQPTPDGRRVCVHAFIGYDKDMNVRVAEILPLDICCWGVGKGIKGSYNYAPAYIQIEICEDGLFDEDYYRKAFGVAAEYCAYLCEKYNLSIGNVISHAEAAERGYGNNHVDTGHWMKNFGESMDDFRRQVSNLVNTHNGNTITNQMLEKNKTFEKGDLVAISENAVYYNGKSIPDWVKKQKWYVKEPPKGDRVVIDKNESGKNSICSAVNSKYLNIIEKNSDDDSIKSKCQYLVKITVNDLNIRSGAGTNYQIVGNIQDKGVYTITEEKKGQGASLWGKLKSGIGWISLDYTTKI